MTNNILKGLLIAVFLLGTAPDAFAAKRRQQVIRNQELVKALTIAAQSVSKNDLEAAYIKLMALDPSLSLTAYETYKLREFKGHIAASVGRHEEAIAHYKVVLTSEYLSQEDRAKINRQMAMLYAAVKQPDKATAAADDIVLGPDSPASDYETVSLIRLHAGDMKGGLEAAKQGMDAQRTAGAPPTPKLLYRAIYATVKLGHQADANTYLDELTLLYPSPVYLRVAMGGYGSIGQTDKVAELREHILDQMRVDVKIRTQSKPIEVIAPRVSETLVAEAMGKEVSLSYDIASDGTVDASSLKVTKNTGPDALGAAAKEALGKWRYQPTKRAGLPVRLANRRTVFVFAKQEDEKALAWFDTDPLQSPSVN